MGDQQLSILSMGMIPSGQSCPGTFLTSIQFVFFIANILRVVSIQIGTAFARQCTQSSPGCEDVALPLLPLLPSTGKHPSGLTRSNFVADC